MDNSLVNNLIEKNYLKSERIIRAFRKIKRADFVPDDLRKGYGDDFIANFDAPLPIGYDQTISQPQTVAFMLELLEPKEGYKILEIGSGSGWQTAMLCDIVGEKGFVYAIEIVPELKEFGEKNVWKYGYKNAQFINMNGRKGLQSQAPFDCIIVAAAGDIVLEVWKEQLKIGGRLVMPVKHSIWLIKRKSEDLFEGMEYPGFAFVPLVGE